MAVVTVAVVTVAVVAVDKLLLVPNMRTCTHKPELSDRPGLSCPHGPREAFSQRNCSRATLVVSSLTHHG